MNRDSSWSASHYARSERWTEAMTTYRSQIAQRGEYLTEIAARYGVGEATRWSQNDE